MPKQFPNLMTARVQQLENLMDAKRWRDDDLSDENVIADPNQFRRRFTFGKGWTPRQRKLLVDFQKLTDLDEKQLYFLNLFGCLKRTYTGIKLIAQGWIAAIGFLQIGYLLLVAATCSIPLFQYDGPMTWQIFICWALMANLVLFAILCYFAYIKPWQLKQELLRNSVPLL